MAEDVLDSGRNDGAHRLLDRVPTLPPYARRGVDLPRYRRRSVDVPRHARRAVDVPRRTRRAVGLAPYLRHLLLVTSAVAAVLLTLHDPRPGVSATESSHRLARGVGAPAACVSTEEAAAWTARVRAIAARNEGVRAVPAEYRTAARHASAYVQGRVRPEFFLALAYNRTLYGAMLKNPATRAYRPRGPVQWELDAFAAAAVAGHRDATRPLDSFLAIAATLRRRDAGRENSPFGLSRLLGSTPDQARADADTFHILTTPPAAPRTAPCVARAPAGRR